MVVLVLMAEVEEVSVVYGRGNVTGDGRLFDLFHLVLNLGKSPAFCRHDTYRRDGVPLYPVAYPNLSLFRHAVFYYWAFGYCASSAMETGVNDEMILPVYWNFLGSMTCPYVPFLRYPGNGGEARAGLFVQICRR